MNTELLNFPDSLSPSDAELKSRSKSDDCNESDISRESFLDNVPARASFTFKI